MPYLLKLAWILPLGGDCHSLTWYYCHMSLQTRSAKHASNASNALQAIAIYHKNKIEFGPAKAANAGGVAVSGLEMAQNSARLSWSKEEVDDKLKGIMKSIFNASKSVSSSHSVHSLHTVE